MTATAPADRGPDPRCRTPATLELEGGTLRLWPRFLEPGESTRLLKTLIRVLPWSRHRVRIGGREHLAPRLSAWIGDPEAVYRYSGLTLEPAPWPPELARLRARVEAACETPFNSVLANLYRDGADSMGWHADNEPELGPEPVVASVSLGAPRRFALRHRRHRGRARAASWRPEALPGGMGAGACEPDAAGVDPRSGRDVRRLDVELGDGTLLLMLPPVQRYWVHSVPKTRRPAGPRLNLTFRLVSGARARPRAPHVQGAPRP